VEQHASLLYIFDVRHGGARAICDEACRRLEAACIIFFIFPFFYIIGEEKANNKDNDTSSCTK
jgi:hypothetical protein